MASFKSLCEKYFGSSNFYEILKVDPNTPDKEIEDDKKAEATEKFKVLGKIHSILQDKDRRKQYDDFGEFDENVDSSFNWMEYWRSMFKKIEIKDIQNYEKEYIGSETELRDIKKAYISSKGNMNKILEMVPFTNCEDESRITGIIQKMVDDGEVERYNAFFNENKQKKARRHKKWEKEKKEAEQIDIRDLEKDIEKNMKQRADQFGKLMAGIEEKYSKKRKSITDSAAKKKKRS
ncbi:hypothetical protein NQ317_010135 [Molorchus minor]|uniref:J domain-containing protein n=1 Tax=Molorchus minor TaxID=1323400 RepID=A0ABQ9JNA0_9CUCU|nr:hypothetical protein NQ317_010135 [Molorchus minor]